ncbi:HAMP domain-containing protein [Peribacillus frigoritolerans]|nr:HAMP domain-containing protein [Peribacillus frigoritolerans]
MEFRGGYRCQQSRCYCQHGPGWHPSLMIIINVILMAIVVGALIWFLTKKLSPLLKVSLAAKEISNGDLLTANKLISNTRVKGNDEIKVLVKSFEEMITNTTMIVNSMKKLIIPAIGIIK